MTTSGRPTLMFALGWEPVSRFVEKGLFGKPYVRFGRFIMAGLWVYQTGAILGRAKRECLPTLAKMFSEPGREEEVINFLQDLAAERIESYAEDAHSFFDFFIRTEYKKAGLNWPPSDLGALKRLDSHRMPMTEVESFTKMYVLEGVAFGAKFPELTERMWKQTYESLDAEEWENARRHGLQIPEQPTPVSLEEMEQQVLLSVASYASEYYPELVEPLGLRLT